MAAPESHRERIVQRIATVLDNPGEGRPQGLTVHRQATRALDRDELPAAVPYVMGEAVLKFEHDFETHDEARAVVQRTARIIVDHRASAPGSDPELDAPSADTLVDTSLTWALTALFSDEVLLGMLYEIEEVSIDWAQDELEEVYAQALQEFVVVYHTPEGDPTTFVTI